MDIRLRQAVAADADFISEVVEKTMRSYVEQVWGSFSEATSRESIAKSIAARIYSIWLYEREGFRVVSTTPERYYMELAP